jgi:hypothetical protein
MMKNLTQWIEEAKKKGTKDSSPPTVTSSPLRGANQDQSGFNGKNSVADYTISDEKIKTRNVKEAAMVSTAGAERSTPTNMKSTGKSPNAMQKAADARRMALDKIAQKQKDEQQKSREQVQKQREQDAAVRDKMKTNN